MFSPEHMAAILKALPDPVFILTRSGRYAAIFGGSDARYYHDGSSLIGQRISDVLVAEKADWFLQEIGKALDSRKLHIVEYGLAGSDVKGLPAEGPAYVIWFEGRVQALDLPVGGEDAVLWVASNITSRNELENKLRLLSETDSMTGLLNRRKFMDALEEQFALFTRHNTPASLLLFDIDDFKSINDKHGHPCGDKVITAIAEICRAELRTIDLPARLGGDEFVVLLPHTPLDQALQVAERLRQRVADGQLCAASQTGQVTISGGLSEFLATDHTGEEIIGRADKRLYRAKRSGRNQMVYQEDDDTALSA